MSEASFDMVLQELRNTVPSAPERLRDRVAALPAARSRRSLRLRPALAVAIALALSIGLGAAIIGGVTGSEPNTPAGRFASASETLRERSKRLAVPTPKYQYKAYSDTARSPFELA